MKKSLLKLCFVILFLVIGLLVGDDVRLRWQVRDVNAALALLQKERIESQSRVAANDPGPKPEASRDARREIEARTSELRGLPFKSPVKYKMIDRAELKRILIKKVQEQYSDEELRGYNRSLVAIGLIPEGTDLLGAMLSLYSEQVAAFYEPAERALYTFKDMAWTSDLDKMLLSHELTHALQDQNFDLRKFPLDVKDNDDLALASSALIEGDATLLMTRFYADNADPLHLLGDLTSMLGQDTTKLRAAPPYLRAMLLFPYQQGEQFVMSLFVSGGTDALNDAFRHRPVSTQQILHPNRFLHDRHDPETVTIPRIDSTDWQLIGSNVLGEFGIQCLFEPSAGLFEAQRVARGWNGDRYHVYEHGKNGPTGLVWVTVWENEEGAKEFEDAYKTYAQKRGVPMKSDRNSLRVTIRQSGEDSFLGLSESIVGH